MNDQSQKIAAFLPTVRLGHGIGTEENPCTMAAINLAINGRLTDDIPECVSPVIGVWIINIQDAIPLDRLNGQRWRALVPAIAGTGREHESERLAIIIDWMWGVVLPQLQPTADAGGYGAEWHTMCEDRTARAARAAALAAARAAWAARTARAAKWAGWAAARAAWAARTARAAKWAARGAAADAARAAADAADAADASQYWTAIDLDRLLERLIMVGTDPAVRSAE